MKIVVTTTFLILKNKRYGKSKRRDNGQRRTLQGLQSLCELLPHEDLGATAKRGQRPRISLRIYGKSGQLHRMLLLRLGLSRRMH